VTIAGVNRADNDRLRQPREVKLVRNINDLRPTIRIDKSRLGPLTQAQYRPLK
jgi:hypothetical protein